MATMTNSRWLAPASGSSQERARYQGSAMAKGSSNSGMRIRLASIGSFLEGGELLGVERRELAVDLVDDDPHDEHADQQVEQHAGFNHQRQRLGQQNAEDEDAVLQNQVADHLGDRLAAADQQQEASEQGGQRGRDEQPALVGGDQRQQVG